MMGAGQRCEMHGTALTSAGVCILCERRGHAPRGRSGPTGIWLVVGVVGVAIAAAVGFRIHLAVADRAASAAALPDTTATQVPAYSAAVGSASASATSTPVQTAMDTASPTPSQPRVDPGDARHEHELRVAEAERSVQIDLYGEGWCPSCNKARAWLDSNAIAYTYRDTSNGVNKHTMRALNPSSTIPTLDIEGQVVVGFHPAAMRAAIRRAAEARVAKSAAASR